MFYLPYTRRSETLFHCLYSNTSFFSCHLSILALYILCHLFVSGTALAKFENVSFILPKETLVRLEDALHKHFSRRTRCEEGQDGGRLNGENIQCHWAGCRTGARRELFTNERDVHLQCLARLESGVWV